VTRRSSAAPLPRGARERSVGTLSLCLVCVGCAPVAEGVGRGLGKAFGFLEVVATVFAVTVTVVAWTLFARGRTRGGALGPVGLAAVVVVHFAPLAIAATETAYPAHGPGLSHHLRAWGRVVAWSLPAAVALLWVVRSRLSGPPRAAARAAILACYGAMVVAFAYSRRPLSLSEPLVEIATTEDRQFSCGRTSAGTVVCLGDAHRGELGGARRHDLLRPEVIDPLSPSQGIFMGGRALCNRRSPTSVTCAGRWEGRSHQTWEASSQAPFTHVLVGSEHLVFVSAAGALEGWSARGRVSIAAASKEASLCSSTVVFRAPDGRAFAHDLDSAERVDLGVPRQLGCYCDAGYCESRGVVVLHGKQLTTRNRGRQETIEAPADAELLTRAMQPPRR
jgi:hypothetical protein